MKHYEVEWFVQIIFNKWKPQHLVPKLSMPIGLYFLVSIGKEKVGEVGRPILPFFYKFFLIPREVCPIKQALSLVTAQQLQRYMTVEVLRSSLAQGTGWKKDCVSFCTKGFHWNQISQFGERQQVKLYLGSYGAAVEAASHWNTVDLSQLCSTSNMLESDVSIICLSQLVSLHLHQLFLLRG